MVHFAGAEGDKLGVAPLGEGEPSLERIEASSGLHESVGPTGPLSCLLVP